MTDLRAYDTGCSVEIDLVNEMASRNPFFLDSFTPSSNTSVDVNITAYSHVSYRDMSSSNDVRRRTTIKPNRDTFATGSACLLGETEIPVKVEASSDADTDVEPNG